MARWAGLVVVAVAAGLTACGGGEAAEAPRSGAAAQSGPPGEGPDRSVPVAVATVERGSIARAVSVSGVVQPIRSVGVNSQVAGVLLSVAVEEGDRVSQGTGLARIDDQELRAQLAAAEAAYQVAEAAFERAEQLRERRVITLPEYEQHRTAHAAARAEVEQLRTRVAYAQVRSPISGVITEKNVEAGDLVAPQTRMFTVADLSTLVVPVGVSELDVVELNVGDRVTVALDAFPRQSFTGGIRRVFPAADPATRLVPVEVALEGPDAAMARPGFLARVTFALSAHDDVLLVPASSLVGGGTGEAVFVMENGVAVRRSVSSGLTSEGRVEIVSGLREGERVIVTGNTALRDGMAVRVVTGPATPVPAEARP